VDKFVSLIMYLDITIGLRILLAIHVIILSIPCIVPKDSGGAPHVKVLHLAFQTQIQPCAYVMGEPSHYLIRNLWLYLSLSS
jgi:hypothetical protein